VKQIEKIINNLSPIQLDEADRVKLFDRTDSKYIFHLKYLPELLNSLNDEYRVLEITGVRNQFYKSLYFDTHNFQLYYRHHNGRFNRYKVRFREYSSTKTFFLEIKFKTNQDRTIKKRCLANEIRMELNENQMVFLSDRIPFPPALLEAQTWTNFNRITLIHKEKAERVTIDTSPQWIFSDKELVLPSLVIAEVKRDKMAKSTFAGLLQQYHIYETGFSKYCIGTALIGPNLRYNLFKPTLLSIKKICKNELPNIPSAAN
jgi:hypothetical protein